MIGTILKLSQISPKKPKGVQKWSSEKKKTDAHVLHIDWLSGQIYWVSG